MKIKKEINLWQISLYIYSFNLIFMQIYSKKRLYILIWTVIFPLFLILIYVNNMLEI